MRLYRTACNTDWKGRATHSIELVAKGDKAKLLAAMNDDVAKIKTDDVQADKELEEDDEDLIDLLGDDETDEPDDEEEENDPSDPWTIRNERWEMDRKKKDEPRILCYKDGDGGTASISYHFVD